MSQIVHIYYRPDEVHGVYKIELNKVFLSDRKKLGRLLLWWKESLAAPDIEEPFENFIADKLAKQSVVAAKDILGSIKRQSLDIDDLFFTQSYRT